MEQGFRVGAWLVQPDLGTVTRGGEQVQLQPKIMEVLVYLARHPNELLPKERVIQEVWPDTFITDDVLAHAVWKLREVFGDDARNPAFIETLPRRGYRLIASVSLAEEGDGSTVAQKASGPPRRALWRHPAFLAVGGGVLVILAALLIWQLIPAAPDGPVESIAILPFTNGTQGDEADYLCVEIPASLSARLSRIEGLLVIPTGNLGRFMNEEVDPRSAADQLGVHAILRGWLTEIGEELSVRVELIDARHDRLLWGESYHRPFTDIFEIQDEIAGRMAAELRPRLTPEQEAHVSHPPTESLEAYEAYLQGEFLLGQPLVGDPRLRESTLSDAVACYRRAIEEDPAFALPYVGLFRTYVTVGHSKTSADAWSEARKAAQKALDLDSSQPQVRLVVAAVRAFWDHDWKAAGDEYATARQLGAVLSLEPYYPVWLLWMGRHDEALEVIEKGSRLADPLSVEQSLTFGYRYYYARRFDQALERGRKTGDPWLLPLCLQAVGEREEAFAGLLSNAVRNSETQAVRSQYERAFATGGLKGFWKQWADRRVLLKDKPIDIAGAYAFAEEKDLAFQWLEKAYELPVYLPFVTDVRFDSLRDDPRYVKLLRKLNLPEEAIARHLAARR